MEGLAFLQPGPFRFLFCAPESSFARFETLTWFGQSLVEICMGKVAPQTPMPQTDRDDTGSDLMASLSQPSSSGFAAR